MTTKDISSDPLRRGLRGNCEMVSKMFPLAAVISLMTLSFHGSGKTWTHPVERPVVQGPVVVLSLGDSMTEGYISGVVDYQHRFTSVLERLLREVDTSSQVVNRGKGGQTSSEGALALSGYLANDHPDIVTILYGANDMLLEFGEGPRVSPLSFGEALRFMVREARAEGVVPLLMSLVPVLPEKYYLTHDRELYEKYGGITAHWESYDLTVRRIAGDEDVGLVDVQELIGADIETALGEDGAHLSAAGHELLGGALMNAIQVLELPPQQGDSTYDNGALESSYVYPNPYRLSSGALLKVHVTVAGPSVLRARVFDVAGTSAATLPEAAFENPGGHSLVWDGKDKNGHPVSPGIYLLSLELIPEGGARRERRVLKVAVLR